MLKFSSKSDVNAECKCIVRLLDDSEVIECDIQVLHFFSFLSLFIDWLTSSSSSSSLGPLLEINGQLQPRCKAQYLLDYVCQQLDVVEKDYFGLRYVDHHKQRKWFDFSKSVANQVRGILKIGGN